MKKSKRKFGLIGKNIAYSFSPKYFNHKFEQEKINAIYQLFDLENINEVSSVFKSSVSGLNVTIPYKQEIIPFLDKISGAAKEIGAVNTIAFVNGKKHGHNTDVVGFKDSLTPLLEPQHNKALILGTGGASKAVAFVLKQLEIPFKYVSRNPIESQLSYSDLTPQIISEFTLIINCTPLGTAPHTEKSPAIPYQGISEKHLVYDLIYNPAQTTFLAKAKAQGATTKNGQEMLELQANAAWEIWNQES